MIASVHTMRTNNCIILTNHKTPNTFIRNDPNVIFGSGFDSSAFFAFVDAEGLPKGQIVGRNEQDSDWYSRVDMKIIQELPSFNQEGRFELYLVMKNLTNFLINKNIESYDGFIALGCVLRGATYHFELISNFRPSSTSLSICLRNFASLKKYPPTNT